MAGNTPFKRWKREVHRGGVADPCIVRLPARLRSHEGDARRHQFAHAVDVVPTLLELVGIAAPAEIDGVAQTHIDGTSFAYVFGEDGGNQPGRHETQHFEMLGSRALYHDGWKAVTYHPVGPLYDDGLAVNAPFDEDVWELYHVAEDFSETDDLASELPDKVAELVARWWEEARRNDVLPLDNRVLDAIVQRGSRRTERETYRYFPGGAPVPEPVAADVRNRSHRISAEVELPIDVQPQGVLLAMGCVLGGWSLHLLGGRLRYVHNLHGRTCSEVLAPEVLTPGRHLLEFSFDKDPATGGRAALHVDGAEVAVGSVDPFTPAVFNEVGIGLTCGYEWGPPVGDGYEAPFTFNGTILRVEVRAVGPVVRDPVAEVAAILAMQ